MTMPDQSERPRLPESGVALVAVALLFFVAATSIIPWGSVWPPARICGSALILVRRRGFSWSGYV